MNDTCYGVCIPISVYIIIIEIQGKLKGLTS